MQLNFRKLANSINGSDLAKDQRGLSTVEYVILLVLIAAACIGLWIKLGDAIAAHITDSTTDIEDMALGESDDD